MSMINTQIFRSIFVEISERPVKIMEKSNFKVDMVILPEYNGTKDLNFGSRRKGSYGRI